LTMVETALVWPTSNFLATYFNEATSKLNPANVGYSFFVYGDFPVILVKWLSIQLHRTAYDQVYLVGRAVVATTDVATVLIAFLLGRQVFRSDKIALLTAFFYACSALAIQQSHFFVVDSMSTFFVILSLLFMVRVYQYGRWSDYVLGGLFVGVSLASKASVYPISFIMVVAAAYRLWLAWGAGQRPRTVIVQDTLLQLVASGLVALVAFRVLQPYAFSTAAPGLALSPRWLSSMLQAKAWQDGILEAPFAWQWTERTPILFPLRNMVLWGMGLPLGITAWAGWAFAGWRLIRRGRTEHLIPWSWTALFFFIEGTQWVKSMRYFLPIYPTLALFAAWALVRLWEQTRSPTLLVFPTRLTQVLTRFHLQRQWQQRASTGLAVAVSGLTLLYAIAFMHVYTTPLTRVAASRWIYAHIPVGTAIANETEWDDALPLPIDGHISFGKGGYVGLNLKLTDADSPQKLQHILDTLDKAQYVVISSNRQYGSMPRMPLRFPMMVRYYHALFSGALGFKKVAEFNSGPSLFGITLDDQSAEEAWTVYDHPRVMIFEKTPAYSRAQAQQLLTVDWNAIVPLSPRQYTAAPTALLLPKAIAKVDEAHGTWSSIFDPASLMNRLPLLFWVLFLLVVGLVGVPVSWLALRPLPDRGLALARPIGVLIISWLIWMVASLHIMRFTRFGIAAAFLVALFGAGVAGWHCRSELLAWLRAHWRLLLLEEGVFWFCFALVVFIRWLNPDLWHPILGGEKPMDFSFLNATIKTSYFPPYDPWFAGGEMNYYYYGFVLAAVPIKLLGIVPAVAYNLVIPTWFAFLATATFAATLALATQVSTRRPAWLRPEFIALFGALCVAVAGNLDEVVLIVQGLLMLAPQPAVHIGLPVVAGVVQAVQGLGQLLQGHPLPFRIEWWYWNATRVIHHPPNEAGPINEMPWFTFLFADLHAHLLAMPYAMGAIAVLIGVVRSLTEHRPKHEEWAHLILLALILGALWTVNTWDVPAYYLLTAAALLFAGIYQRGWWRGSLTGIGRTIVTVALAYAFFLPFHHNYAAPPAGIGLWQGSRTPLADYVTIWGFFLFLTYGALLLDFFRASDLNPVVRYLRLRWRYWYRWSHVTRLGRVLLLPRPAFTWGLGMVWTACIAAAGLVLLHLAASALALLTLTFIALLFVRRPPANAEPLSQQRLLWQWTLALLFLAVGITLGVEFIVIKNVDIGRMNTVFKFYIAAWLLWGLASAICAARVFAALPRLRPQLRSVWQYGFGALFAAVLLYPVCSTIAKVQDRFDVNVGHTLNGMAFMTKAKLQDHGQVIPLRDDLAAIRWMQEHVHGSPVIAEENTAPVLYGWGDRFAWFTGNPDVIGWQFHEQQQRMVVPQSMVNDRVTAVQQAYAVSDPQVAYNIFARYGVTYIIVGGLERAYAPQGMAKWAAGVGRYWTVAYQHNGDTIYKMIPQASSTQSAG
ncbi:MAG: DUF2298 domain-containing protein, partial [Chloroflexi bacterium]|nr:DUF2298 domain-containing protein [Chloroflexota bacterium]